MKVAIVGSRTFRNRKRLFDEMDGLTLGDKPLVPTLIISGGASGADTLARAYAKARGIPLKEILPDWKTHGRAAGPIRNREIVKQADLVVGFWDGVSPGTKSTYDATIKAKKVFIHIKP